MSAASLKLPLVGMGVVLAAGVAAWLVFSSADDAGAQPVTPLSARAAVPEPTGFRGGPADERATPTEVLAPAPVTPASLDGRVRTAGSEAATQAERAPVETVDLTGRVVDGSGRAIEGATVTFQADPIVFAIRRGGDGGEARPAAPSATTARDGSFKLHAELPAAPRVSGDIPLPAIAPQLATRHELFATLVTSLPELAAGSRDVGTLVMDPGAWISGRAVDSKQRPVAGATVTGRNEGGGSRGGRGRGRGPGGPGGFFGGLTESIGSVTTGPDGRFTVSGMREGKAGLTVQKQGLRLGSLSDLDLLAGVPLSVGDVVLEDGELIAGVVVDEQGVPISGASVSVSSLARIVVNRIEDLPRQQIGQEFGQRVTSDAEGHFEVAGLAGGTYTVHVASPGCAELQREDVPAGTRNLRLAPVRLGSLLISLQDKADGKPIEHARIKATQATAPGEFAAWRGETVVPVLEGAAAMKAAGLEEPSSGAYFVAEAGLQGTNLVVAAEGYATQEIAAPAAVSGQLSRFGVQLVPAAVVAGRVLDRDDQPVADALVEMEVDQQVDDGVVDLGGGRREIRRALRIGRDDGGEGELSAERLTARTGADGTFVIAGASAGDWTLHVTADGFVSSPNQKLTLADGQSQRDLTVVLDTAGRVAGMVTESDGTPVADIEVTATPATAAAAAPATEDRGGPFGRFFGRGGVEGERRARTRIDGTYVIDGLKEGDYVARLGNGRRGMNLGGAMVFPMEGGDGSDPSNPSTPAHVIAGQETRVDFVRPKRASLGGRVLAAGAPVPGVTVTMRRAGGLPFGGERATTDDRGEYRFADVEAGSYDVSALAPGAGLERKQTVKLVAGQEQLADLSFSGSTVSGRVVDSQSGAGVAGIQITMSPARDASKDEAPREAMAFSIITSDGPGGAAPAGLNMTINGGSVSGVRTDSEGQFELKYVEAGRYSLEAEGAGYMRTTKDSLEVADGRSLSDVKLEVSRGGIVEGRVRSGSTGESLDKVPVRLSSDGDEQMSVTSDGGRYRFDGLQPGDYSIDVLGSGFGSEAIATKTVKVKAGETATADLSTKG